MDHGRRSSNATARFADWAAVSLGRTVSSISFSRKAAFIPPEAQAPQPDHNVHEGAHSRLLHIIGPSR
jgi:hypothetical protein